MSINDQTQLATEAIEYMQTVPAKLLAAAARGELDLNMLARQELANRGLDCDGKWVGFEKARQLHSSSGEE